MAVKMDGGRGRSGLSAGDPPRMRLVVGQRHAILSGVRAGGRCVPGLFADVIRGDRPGQCCPLAVVYRLSARLCLR